MNGLVSATVESQMAILKSIEGHRITMESGVRVKFPFPVAQAIEFDDVIVVRVQPPRGTIFNQNVYGIDPNGQVAWQIQALFSDTEDVAWGGLENWNGQPVLSNWQSKIAYLDPKTGAVLKFGMQPY